MGRLPSSTYTGAVRHPTWLVICCAFAGCSLSKASGERFNGSGGAAAGSSSWPAGGAGNAAGTWAQGGSEGGVGGVGGVGGGGSGAGGGMAGSTSMGGSNGGSASGGSAQTGGAAGSTGGSASGASGSGGGGPVNVTLVDTGALWRYRHEGSQADAGWYWPEPNTAAWQKGASPLGFDEGNFFMPATVLSWGSDADNKPITAYFALPFTPNGTVLSAELRFRRDDAIVIYLDGKEIVRNNIKNGAIAYATRADVCIDGTAENEILTRTVDVSNFASAPVHIIAAEIHQCSKSSSDLIFNLELDALISPN